MLYRSIDPIRTHFITAKPIPGGTALRDLILGNVKDPKAWAAQPPPKVSSSFTLHESCGLKVSLARILRIDTLGSTSRGILNIGDSTKAKEK